VAAAVVAGGERKATAGGNPRRDCVVGLRSYDLPFPRTDIYERKLFEADTAPTLSGPPTTFTCLIRAGKED
jgi:hypothetical protein